MIRRRRRQPRRRRRQRRWRLRQVVKPAAAAGQRGSCAVDSIASLRKLTALPRGSQEEEGGGGVGCAALGIESKSLATKLPTQACAASAAQAAAH